VPVKGQLSLKLPEERNLIAVHNMDSDRLHQVAETGIASPSIAIVHKDKGFTPFGNISLLVHPSHINPRHTPVYDRDVFTPTFKASIVKEGKLNPERFEGFKKEVHAAAKKVGASPELIEAQLEGVIKGKMARGMALNSPGPHVETLATHLPKSVMEELGQKQLDSFGEPYASFDNLREKVKGLYDNSKFARFKDGTKIELTPENEKAILKQMRPRTIKGGEYGGLRSDYYRKDGNIDEALDIHAARRFKSFADIKRGAKDKLVSSGSGKYSMLPYSELDGKYSYDKQQLYRTALKAVEKGTPISEYISRHGVKDMYGKRVDEQEGARVGQILDNWYSGKKKEKTEYFEAKPQKFFHLNDFSAAVVPHTEFDNLKDYFAQHGVHAVPYRDQEERIRLVNQLAQEHKLMLSEKEWGLEELVKNELVEDIEDCLELEELYKAAEELDLEELAKGEPPGLIDGVDFGDRDIEAQPKVVLAIITDGCGKLLFIKRVDNGKWSLPGGHIELELGENAESAIRREVEEETGVKPEYFSVIHYSRLPFIAFFSAQVQGLPHNRQDPDAEGKPQWVDITRGIPKNVWNNLSGPEDESNIIRQLFAQEMGLQKSEYNWLDAGFLDLSK
jgi:8-oxo-dGTP pyrophosphatase MutT (NUDIX family)